MGKQINYMTLIGGYSIDHASQSMSLTTTCMYMCISAIHVLYIHIVSVGIMTLLPSEGGVIHLKASRISQSQSQSQLYFSDVPFGPTMVSS